MREADPEVHARTSAEGGSGSSGCGLGKATGGGRSALRRRRVRWALQRWWRRWAKDSHALHFSDDGRRGVERRDGLVRRCAAPPRCWPCCLFLSASCWRGGDTAASHERAVNEVIVVIFVVAFIGSILVVIQSTDNRGLAPNIVLKSVFSAVVSQVRNRREEIVEAQRRRALTPMGSRRHRLVGGGGVIRRGGRRRGGRRSGEAQSNPPSAALSALLIPPWGGRAPRHGSAAAAANDANNRLCSSTSSSDRSRGGDPAKVALTPLRPNAGAARVAASS